MSNGFIPRNPGVGNPDTFFMKAWFKEVRDFCYSAVSVALPQTTGFMCRDQEFYPVDTSGGAVVGHLPPAVGLDGRRYTIKNYTGVSTVTILPDGTDTIEGSASYVIGTVGDSVTFASDGSGTWWVEALGGSSGLLGSPLTTKGDLWGYSTTNARVAVGTDGKVLTADSTKATGVDWKTPTVTTAAGSDKQIQFNDGGTAFGGDADFTWDKTTNTLTFGTATYIKGDMTNATANNRLKIQNSVVNGNSVFYIVPNGSSTTSLVRTTNKDDLTAALGYLQVGVSGNSAVIDANILNAGTQPDIDIRIAAVSALNIDITKNAQFKAGLQKPVRTITSNDSLLETDGTIFADCTTGNITLTLPAANVAGAGFTPLYHIKRIDSSANSVTLSRAGADTIDGATTYVLGALQGVVLVSDGSSKWGIV